MSDTKQYANSYIDPSDNQRRYFLDLEATHKDDASDPNTVLGGIKSTADNAETIAMGATRAMVFDTIADMETWLKDAANKGKLKIGDNLYIKAVDVPDFWVSAVYETATPEGFYYNYSRLEVGTIKLSNVVTTDSDIATSLNYVFGLLGTNSKRISVSDLAKLFTPLYPFFHFFYGYIDNLDVLKSEKGISFCCWNNNTLGRPLDNYGFCVTFVYDFNSIYFMGGQIAFSSYQDAGHLYTRCLWSNDWQDWVKIV